MKLYLRKVLLVALAALSALGLLFGVSACGDTGEDPVEPKTLTYTVTVTSEDTLPDGLKVAIKSGETVKAEKAPENGSAAFTLEEGTYTATLTNVPEEYTFEDATLTPQAPAATIALSKKTTPPPAEEKVTYTVTVVCVDDILADVSVQLLADTTIVGEAPLEGGKATFELDPGDYTVALKGLPAGYEYAEAAVSAENPSVTVNVTGEAPKTNYTYIISLFYEEATDVFGATHAQGPAAGVPVLIYENEADTKPLGSALMTPEDGMFSFSFPNESYTLVFSSPSYRLKDGATSFTVTKNPTSDVTRISVYLEPKGVLGTEEAPLLWTVGENDVPLTQAVLEQYENVYYAFTPTKDGTYYITTKDEDANLTSSVLSDAIVGSEFEVPVELTKGTAYRFTANSNGIDDFGYTVTISDTKAPVDDSDPNPNAPWEGDGTKANPYIVENFIGEYEVVIAWRNDAFRYVYFSYTATEDGEYLVKGESDEYFVRFSNGQYIHPNVLGSLNDDSSVHFEVKKGAVLTFDVENYDEDATATFTAKFKVAKYEKPAPSLGSKENPQELETLEGTYQDVSVDPTYYYSYTESEDGGYSISTMYALGLHISIRDAETDAVLNSFNVAANGTGVFFSLTAGKTYIIGVSSNSSGEYGGAEVVSFKIEVSAPPAEPDGTEANPYPLKTLLGDHSYETNYDPGVWYSYELEEDMTVYVTTKTAVILKLGDKSKQFGKANMTESFALKAGTVKMHVQFYGQDSGKVEFNIATLGSKDYPEALTTLVGTHTFVTGYQKSLSYYVSWKETEGADYTFTVKGVGKLYISGGDYNEKSLTNTNTAVEENSADFTFEKDVTYTIRFECYNVLEGPVTFTVVKKGEELPNVTYTVEVLSAASDLFGNTFEAAPAAGVSVELLLGTDSVASSETNAEGKAVFEVAENATYTVKVAGSDETYTFTDKAVSVTLKSDVVYGTEGHPLTLQEGTTKIPYTQELLAKLYEDDDFTGAYYAFTPAKSGNYLFAVSEEWALVMVYDGADPLLGVGSMPGLAEGSAAFSGSAALEGGKTYTVVAASFSDGYDLSISLESETQKWTGSGTEADPYVITELADTYTVTVTYENDTFNHVYFTYTAAEAGTYTISTKSESNFVISINGGTLNLSNTEKSKEFSLKAGEKLQIKVMEFDEEVTGSFTVTFTIAVYTKPNGLNNPQVLQTLEGEYTVTLASTATTWYFSYTTTEDADYHISSDYKDGVVWGVRTSQWGNATSYEAEAGKPANFSLVAGKTYYLSIRSKNNDEGATITFTIEKGKAEVGGGEGGEGGGETSADGSKEHPFVIENIVGEHTFTETSSGHYYTFTVAEAGTYTFTAITMIYISEGVSFTGNKLNYTKDFKFEAKAYTMKISTFGGVAEGEVTFSVAKKVETPAEVGSKDNPEVLTSLPATLTKSVAYGQDYYISYTPTKDETYTITNQYSKSVTLLVGGGIGNQIVGANKSINLLFKANTAMTIGIRLSVQTPEEVTLAFSAFVAPEIPWTQGSGTKEDPYVITSLTETFEVTVSSSVWFKFVATKDATYTFTPKTQISITLDSEHVWASNSSKVYSVNSPTSTSRKQDSVTLKTGDTLQFNVANAGTSTLVNVVSFTVEEGVPETAETALDGETALPLFGKH